MTLSRAEIATYLDPQFSSLAASIGQAASDDTASGYGPDVDNALRGLGKSESELATATVEDGQRDKAFGLAEYFAARRFWRRLGDRVDHTMNESRFDFRDQRKSAKEMMEDAAHKLVALGVDVTGKGWSDGWLNLDWLEPEVETDA